MLRTTNDAGVTQITKSSIINVAPTAAVVSFTASPTSGAYPLAVQFTDTSQGVVTSWLWAFGDGTTSTLQNPLKTYTVAGQYTVSLTSTNAGGSNTSTVPNYINVTNSPPTAVFSASPVSGPIPLAVTFTNSSAGVGNTYTWDFNNDGSPDSTAFAPTANFTSPGVYSVRLTAMNNGGFHSELKTNLITVTNQAPVSNFSASPVTGPFPLVVNFTDTTPGIVASRLWNFGDGQTSTLQNPNHAYTTHGNFTVTLTSTNDGGSNTKTVTNMISTKYPIQGADFTATPTTGNVPLAVTFTNTTTGQAGTWLWDFGDGTTSTLQNPTKTYSTAGVRTVTLTATNDGGSNTRTRAGYVTAVVAPPVANFTASVTTGTVPKSVNFTDTSTGSPTSWSWDFGDGTFSTLQNPTKNYTVAGTYTVKLTATNAGGSNQKVSTNMLTFTAVIYNYMDPANKGTGMTVSGSNLVLSAASDGIIVGKYGFDINGSTDGEEVYWEMIINARGSGIWFGLVKAGHPLTAGSYPGQRAYEYSFSSNGRANSGGVATVATYFDPTWLAQGIDGVGLRFDRNGGYSASQRKGVGNNSGAGAPWFGGGSIPSGTYYPCIRLTGGANVTVNFGPTMGIRSYGVWTSAA